MSAPVSITGIPEVYRDHPQLQGHFAGQIPSYMQAFKTSVGGEVLELDTARSEVRVGVAGASEDVIFASPEGIYPAGEQMTFTATARVVARDSAVLLRYGTISSDLRDGIFFELTEDGSGDVDRLVFRSATFSQSEMEVWAPTVGGTRRANPEGLTGCEECVIPRSAWVGLASSGLEGLDFDAAVAALFRVLWYGIVGIRPEVVGFGRGVTLRPLDMRAAPKPYWRFPNHHVFWQAVSIGTPAGLAEIRAICFKYSTPQTALPPLRRKGIHAVRTTGFSGETHLLTVRNISGAGRPFRSFDVSVRYEASGGAPVGKIRVRRNAVFSAAPTYPSANEDSHLEYDSEAATTIDLATGPALGRGQSPLGFYWDPEVIGAEFNEQLTTSISLSNEEIVGCYINGTVTPTRETLSFTFEAVSGTPSRVAITVRFEEF